MNAYTSVALKCCVHACKPAGVCVCVHILYKYINISLIFHHNTHKFNVAYIRSVWFFESLLMLLLQLWQPFRKMVCPLICTRCLSVYAFLRILHFRRSVKKKQSTNTNTYTYTYMHKTYTHMHKIIITGRKSSSSYPYVRTYVRSHTTVG